jgi:hypothetical protein
MGPVYVRCPHIKNDKYKLLSNFVLDTFYIFKIFNACVTQPSFLSNYLRAGCALIIDSHINLSSFMILSSILSSISSVDFYFINPCSPTCFLHARRPDSEFIFTRSTYCFVLIPLCPDVTFVSFFRRVITHLAPCVFPLAPKMMIVMLTTCFHTGELDWTGRE